MTHQSTVSVVVRRLVRRKLVKKTRAADDARRVELILTPAGRALLRRAPESVQAQLARAIAGFDAADRRSLVTGLQRLVRILGGKAEPAPMFFESP